MAAASPDAPFPGAGSTQRDAGVTRATANPELPGHLPGAGKTRSKVNRSRSAAGAGLGAQWRGRAERTEVGTSSCLARPPACRAPRRRSCRPPAPPPAATAAVGPIYGSAAAGSGRRGRRSREPAPALTSAARAAICSYCKAFPCGSERTELRAMRPGREGAGTRTAPGGALTNLAGWAMPAARPAPESETPGWGRRGRARRLPGAAEPLRSPRYPFSVCPTRSVPLEASPRSVTGGGAGPSRDTCFLGLCALHGVPTAPVDKGTPPRHPLLPGPVHPQSLMA